MSDRIAGLIVVIVALAFFASATQLEEPFFPDPVGPKVFPMLVAGIAMISGIAMMMKPDAEPGWPRLAILLRLFFATIILIIYAFALKPLGFIISTILAASAISYQINANPKAAAIIGFVLSVGLFIIFKYALGLSLVAFPG